MAAENFDIEDVPPTIVMVILSGVTAGVLKITAYNQFNVGDALSIGGLEITLAALFQFAAIATVAATNEIEIAEFKFWEEPGDNADLERRARYLAGGMVVAIMLIEFVPAIQNFVTSNDILGTLVVLIETAGIIALSWMS